MSEITKEAVDELLSGSYTPTGIEIWWERKQTQLRSRTPKEVWESNDEAGKIRVYGLAYSLAFGGMGT